MRETGGGRARQTDRQRERERDRHRERDWTDGVKRRDGVVGG